MKNKLIIFIMVSPFFLSMRCAEEQTSITVENHTKYPILLLSKQDFHFYDRTLIQRLVYEKDFESFKILPDSIGEITIRPQLISYNNDKNKIYLFYFYRLINERGELSKSYDSIAIATDKIIEGKTNYRILVKDKAIEFLKR